MKKSILALIALIPLLASAQMVDSLRAKEPWRLYVFVSTNMPSRALISLAKEAASTQATLVLKGFPGTATLNGAREYAEQINRACCDKQGPGWIVHPKLYENFDIRSVPAFVLTKSDVKQDSLTSIVAGDMGVSNALKFFAQESKSDHVRAAARRIYERSFRTD